MPNGFNPQTAFEGYVTAKLEAITDRLDSLPCKESFEKVNKNANDIANIKGKAAGIGLIVGGIAGFISGILAALFRFLLEK